jgi:hypothetical protein
MITLFVDESGNLGRGERFFIIAMLQPFKSKRIVNFARDFCAKNNLIEIKGAKLNFVQKQSLIDKLTKTNDYVISYIVADKKNIDNDKLFEDPNLLYNYLFSFLIRKTLKANTDDLCILLDNHSTKVKSINSLKDYIKLKAYTQWGFNKSLDIDYINSKYSKVIQVTDVVASCIRAKYHHNNPHLYNRLTIAESIKFPVDKFGT